MMFKDYSNRNLQQAHFVNVDLGYASFAHSDLRGADFSNSNLTGVDFTYVKTGITPLNTAIIFIVALLISLLSGYFAMLTGHMVQYMIASPDRNVRLSGIITIIFSVLFVAFALWKGGGRAIRNLIGPACIIALIVGGFSWLMGAGTGLGMLYQVFAFLLLVLMVVVGTIARAAAGVLSNIIFLIVALAGGMFGKSIGGGAAAIVLALACAQISKNALSNKMGFEFLRKIAIWVIRRFGTSFRNATLTHANFSMANIKSTDFTGAEATFIEWGDTKRKYCITYDTIIIEKRTKWRKKKIKI